MKLIALCLAVVLPFRRQDTPPAGSILTPELISRIRYLCSIASGGHGSGSGIRSDKVDFVTDDYRMDPEELYSQVFFKLTNNDCDVLRNVGSDLPTNAWLKKVIRSTAVDMFRHELGRIDWEKLGSHSQLICRLVISYDYPAEDARELMLKHYGVDIPVSEIDRIVSAVRNRKRIKPDPEWEADVYNQIDEETGMMEQIFVDNRQDAEKILSQHQEITNRENMLKMFLSRLKPDDKLLISLCFGLEGEPMTMKEIAAILGNTETALNKRKVRLFDEFRVWMGKQHVSLDEMVCRFVKRSYP